jgi:phosphate-selective porin OprO/OprP
VPLYSDDGRKVVHLGVSYSHQWHNPVAYASRPEVHLAPVFVNTGRFSSIPGVGAISGADKLALESALVLGPFSLQAEGTLSWIDPSQQSSRNLLWGAYAEASWFLTGEHRNYNPRKASFRRIKLNNRFHFGAPGWGALQVAARYSYLDLNDGLIQGGQMQDFTAGVNWYMFRNLRFMANYVHSWVQNLPAGGGHANMFQMRAQIDF